MDRYETEDYDHDNQVDEIAQKYPYNWKDEPLIFVCMDVSDVNTYRLIDGNHRSRRYLRQQTQEFVKCYVGIIQK